MERIFWWGGGGGYYNGVQPPLSEIPGSAPAQRYACKVVYQNLPDARDIHNRHGKLKGLVANFPYLSLNGGPPGGTYLLVLELSRNLTSKPFNKGCTHEQTFGFCSF